MLGGNASNLMLPVCMDENCCEVLILSCYSNSIVSNMVSEQWTLNAVLALAVAKQWTLRQADVNNAFLNGDLNEENGHFTYILVYDDDIIIIGQSTDEIDKVVKLLNDKFSLKYIGELSFFLGIEVKRDVGALFLNQRKYVLELLEKMGMQNVTPTPTPVVTTSKLVEADWQVADGLTKPMLKPAFERFRDKVNVVRFIFRNPQEHLTKGVRDLKQRHAASFLAAVEKGVCKKLKLKDVELETVNRKNRELVERIKQVTMEAKNWHYRAKQNESVVNVLKTNLEQVISQSQGAEQLGKEGFGDSEIDDAASYIDPVSGGAKCVSGNHHGMICRA
ncbi:Detected protein of confused Function [Hibiscus syriacus]|uniref:Detected protein of confused Function n=1 Tax=Hibiscus syriacus TaxID=106335 RepID=A0A6A3A438_HIBSY|nr:Detected protein of confused Function [Hibiscus syriacus]